MNKIFFAELALLIYPIYFNTWKMYKLNDKIKKTF